MAASTARRQRRSRSQSATTTPTTPDRFDVMGTRVRELLVQRACYGLGDMTSTVNSLQSLSDPRQARRYRKTISDIQILLSGKAGKYCTISHVVNDPDIEASISSLVASPLGQMVHALKSTPLFQIESASNIAADLRSLAATHRTWLWEANDARPDGLPEGVRNPYAGHTALIIRFDDVVVLRSDARLPFRSDGALDCGTIYIFLLISEGCRPLASIDKDVVSQCDRRFAAAGLRPLSEFYTPTHPHINAYGEMCLGDGYSAVTHFQYGRVFDGVMVLDTMLRTTTRGAHYFSIPDMQAAAAIGMFSRVGLTQVRCSQCNVLILPVVEPEGHELTPTAKEAVDSLVSRWAEWYTSPPPTAGTILNIVTSGNLQYRATVHKNETYCQSCRLYHWCSKHKQVRSPAHLMWNIAATARVCHPSHPCVVTPEPSPETPNAPSDETRQRLAEAARNRRRNPDGTFAPEGPEEGNPAPGQPAVEQPADPPAG